MRTTTGGLLAAVLALGTGAPPAHADFFFSTGNPDGKIATLARPAAAGEIQTESADDFVLAENTLINQATFTGLLPSGAPLRSRWRSGSWTGVSWLTAGI